MLMFKIYDKRMIHFLYKAFLFGGNPSVEEEFGFKEHRMAEWQNLASIIRQMKSYGNKKIMRLMYD